MIIKRKLKSAMPSLKRCRGSDSGGDDDEFSRKSRKKRSNGSFGYYPLHLFGDVVSGMITLSELGFHFAAGVIPGFCSDTGAVVIVDSKPTKQEIEDDNSNAVIVHDSVREPARPPVVRTSRGRVQVLPSRFNDSVLDNWKKEKSRIDVDHFDPEFAPSNKEKTSLKVTKTRDQIQTKKLYGDKVSYKYRKSLPKFEDEDNDDGYEYGSFEMRNNTRFGEEEDEDVKEILVKRDVFSKPKEKVKEPDEFSPGDIVWAKSGKHYPAWPAIVLDPEMHAPQQVLGFRVDGAFCVMFFGYSGNGTQRVSFVEVGIVYMVDVI